MMCKSNAPHSISREIVWLHTYNAASEQFWGTDGRMGERRMARHRETIAKYQKMTQGREEETGLNKKNTHEWKELQIKE